MTTAASSARPGGLQRVWVRGLMLTALVAGAWAVSTGQAQARDDVYWSIGVHSPGVAVGVSNAPPPPVVVHQAYPVYTPYPAHVHQPRPVYQRPIVVQTAPVVVHPYRYPYVRPVVVERPWRGHGPRWDDRGHGRHEGRHEGRHKGHHKNQHRHDDEGRRGGHDGWRDHRD